MGSPYTFGDQGVPAERLQLLARAFEPSSRAFIQTTVDPRPELAIDLGCGPGATTRLLADVLSPRLAVGLDASGSFVSLARQEAPPAVEFRQHDVTVTPLPCAPADVIYGRFLLAHLSGPERLVESWAGQLRRGGRLLIEEVEEIETDADALAYYLDRLTAFMAGRGQELHVGRTLAGPLDERLVVSRATRVRLDTGLAATLFSMNLAAWGTDAVADGVLTAAQLDGLGRDVAEIATAPGPAQIEWTLREIALENR